MSPVGMTEQSDERRLQFEAEATRIVNSAAEKGLILRLLGSLAFHLHCPGHANLQKQLGRAYTDIDCAGYHTQTSKMAALFSALGYAEDPEVNLYFAGQRSIFNNPSSGIHVDIFYDKLNFCHEINWVGRLEIETLTLPLAEMLLEKMQIIKINEKDIIDTIMLLLEHALGESDLETINIARISKLCALDWGLWRTVTMNLGKVAQLAQGYIELGAEEKKQVSQQVESALARINEEPKPLAWKVRAKVGDRVKWYQDVEEVS